MCCSVRICSGLQMVELEEVMRLCPDLMLWVLMVGRAGNPPPAEVSRIWFEKGIEEIEERFGIGAT